MAHATGKTTTASICIEGERGKKRQRLERRRKIQAGMSEGKKERNRLGVTERVAPVSGGITGDFRRACGGRRDRASARPTENKEQPESDFPRRLVVPIRASPVPLALLPGAGRQRSFGPGLFHVALSLFSQLAASFSAASP